MCNVLLFGKNGMLGKYVDKYLSINHNVTSIDRKTIDATNVDYLRLQKLIDSNDVVINCYGLIKQRIVSDRDMILVNSVFPNILSTMCFIKNIPFIHITTDCVFDGKIGKYDEMSEHSFDDIYGCSKSSGEPMYGSIIRTSIIGEEVCNKKSLLEWILAQVGEANGYTNHYWNGVTCLELSKVIDNIISSKNYWNGVRIVHSNTVSKFDIVEMVNDIYALNLNIIPKEVEPCDRSMCSVYEYPQNLISKNIKEQIIEMKNWIYG